MKNTIAIEKLRQTIEKIEGAYAPSTIRAYKSNFENFIKFCGENNISALPASNEIVASYIKKLSSHLKSSSVKIAIASVAAIHNLNSLNDPTQSPDVKIEMRRMYRTLGRYAKQAYGINKHLLDKMVAATDNSLRGIRDRTTMDGCRIQLNVLSRINHHATMSAKCCGCASRAETARGRVESVLLPCQWSRHPQVRGEAEWRQRGRPWRSRCCASERVGGG